MLRKVKKTDEQQRMENLQGRLKGKRVLTKGTEVLGVLLNLAGEGDTGQAGGIIESVFANKIVNKVDYSQ